MNGSLVVAFAVVLLLLAGAGALGGDVSERRGSPPPAEVARIAERVERLRGLRFPRPPRVDRVSAEQTRRKGLEDFDRSYPEAARRADEEVLKLLGLLGPRDDLRRLAGSVLGEQVAGFYDPRTKRLAIVDGPAAGDPAMDELVVAHELTHALEDGALELRDETLEGGADDASLAYAALLEGTATAVMLEYAQRHLSAEQAIGGLLDSALQSAGTEQLPPFLLEQLTFPYAAGRAFVEELHRLGGDGWTLVDLAHRRRPPESTEQILHPRKWVAAEPPDRVRLGVRKVLGPRWRRLAAETLGEWATRTWLASADAAAGWGGDRYELWRREVAGSCAAPCVAHDALVVRWRMDTARDADELSAAVRARSRAPRGGALVVQRGPGSAEVTMALAPDAGLAGRLARSG